MTREQLRNIYLDYVNNYLTLDKFAEHTGLHIEEAEKLLELVTMIAYKPHPDA